MNEQDAIRGTLLASWRCEVPGCDRHIWEGTRCHRHGGEAKPEWETSADGVRFFFSSGDTEDEPPKTAA